MRESTAKPITASHPAAVAKSKQEPRAEPSWRRELTPFQEQVAELASDLIINGGDHEDTTMMVQALISHSWRRRFTDLERWSKPSLSEPNHAAKWAPDWVKRLSRHWPEEPPLPTEPRPKAVSAMIRANLRGELRRQFEDFMQQTEGLEDTYLLNNVLANVNGMRGELGEALAYEVGNGHTYVQVPWKLEKRVRKFAELLENGDEENASCSD